MCLLENGETTSTRANREIAHGKSLAKADPELVWGWGTPAGRSRARRRAEMIARGAQLGPGVRALEIGCGTGLFTEMFARTGAHMVAVDISEELLQCAQNRGFSASSVEFVLGSFEECVLRGPFDAVVGSSVLHHLDLHLALPRIFHVLKPSGRMAFAEPNMLNPQILIQKNVSWIKERLGDSPDETAFFRWRLQEQLSRTGFVEISIQPFDWLHPATPRRAIEWLERLGQGLEKTPGIRELAGSLLVKACRSIGRGAEGAS